MEGSRLVPRFGALLALLCAAFASTPSTAAAQAKATRPVWPDEGPSTWTGRVTTPDITANDLRTRLYQFADDSMMGRRIGELGNYKGTSYIGREFQRLGLAPAGENGTYFQTLPYGPAGIDAANARLIADGAPLSQKTEWIPLAPGGIVGASGRADLDGVPTVFAGRWGDTTALDEARFRGKLAVFVASPVSLGLMGRQTGPTLRCDSVPDKFGAAAAARVEAAQRAADSAAVRRGVARSIFIRDTRAQRAGAAGVLLVALDSTPRATIDAAFTPRGAMQPSAPSPQAVSGAVISSVAAAKLFGHPVEQVAVGTTGAPVTAHWQYEWHASQWPARNVIAVLRGSDPARAGEYVLVSAHNDHVGTNPVAVDHDSLRAVNMVTRRQGANDPVCRPTPEQQHEIDSLIARARGIRPPRRDSIMNGADDDGSGTVLLLEIAEKFARERPARSVIFVSHEGEEAGLLGSRWFTDHPTIPLDSVVAALNMDMEGKGRVDQVKFGGPASIQTLGARRESREFGDVIDSLNAVRREVMAIDKTWDVTANPMNRFCRSDQVNYVYHHIPVTYFSTGYAEDYHQPTDEPRYIDYDHMARVGRFVHDIAYALAVRKTKPAITGPDQEYPICR